MKTTIAELLRPGTPVLVFGGRTEITNEQVAYCKTFGGRVLDHDATGLLLEDADWGVCLVPWLQITLLKIETEGGSS